MNLNLPELNTLINQNLPLFALLVAWSLVWKGIALWKAAQHGARWWFIILLVTNTAGILELIYIFFVAKNYNTDQAENVS